MQPEIGLQTNVSSEMSSLFQWNPRSSVGSSGKKKRKDAGTSHGKSKNLPSWTHLFVCLASCAQNTVPDSDERALLQIAELGEKTITFYLSSEAQDIYQDLLFHFPISLHKVVGLSCYVYLKEVVSSY